MPSDQNASTLKVRQPTDFLKLVSPLFVHISENPNTRRHKFPQNCDRHSKAQIFCKSFVILIWGVVMGPWTQNAQKTAIN